MRKNVTKIFVIMMAAIAIIELVNAAIIVPRVIILAIIAIYQSISIPLVTFPFLLKLTKTSFPQNHYYYYYLSYYLVALKTTSKSIISLYKPLDIKFKVAMSLQMQIQIIILINKHYQIDIMTNQAITISQVLFSF